jgi:putative FmdB family regulatory protein
MPTYEYVCRECGHHLEVVQSFTDDPLTTCERCQGPLRKVFSAAGIIFKGSGYYVTDTRAEKAPARSGSAGGDSGTASETGSGESSGGSDDTSSSGSTSSGSTSSDGGSSDSKSA